MKYSDNALNIITLKSYKGIGNAWIVKNIAGKKNVDDIVNLLNSKSKQSFVVTIEHFETEKNKIQNKIDALGDFCDGCIALGDLHFPKYRGNVKESEQPVYLFYKGNLSLLDDENKNITVIGLLNPSTEIEEREKKLVSEITKREITIVSGLAFGCDSIAHRQALIGGNTVAILPSPLNNILPAKNRELAYEIIDNGGLLITEYYEIHQSAMELNTRYKDRDRLQALFSDAVILVASYAKNSATIWNITNQKLDSGARLAMEFAGNYQIPRAIMYNHDVDYQDPMFDLNRELLATNSVSILTPKVLDNLVSEIHHKKTHAIHQTGLF